MITAKKEERNEVQIMKKKAVSLISVLLLVALVAGIAPAALAAPSADAVKIGIPDDATNGGSW